MADVNEWLVSAGERLDSRDYAVGDRVAADLARVARVLDGLLPDGRPSPAPRFVNGSSQAPLLRPRRLSFAKWQEGVDIYNHNSTLEPGGEIVLSTKLQLGRRAVHFGDNQQFIGLAAMARSAQDGGEVRLDTADWFDTYSTSIDYVRDLLTARR